jgi:hypothetical protein
MSPYNTAHVVTSYVSRAKLNAQHLVFNSGS